MFQFIYINDASNPDVYQNIDKYVDVSFFSIVGVVDAQGNYQNEAYDWIPLVSCSTDRLNEGDNLSPWMDLGNYRCMNKTEMVL
jgi:hypothetical protein